MSGAELPASVTQKGLRLASLPVACQLECPLYQLGTTGKAMSIDGRKESSFHSVLCFR